MAEAPLWATKKPHEWVSSNAPVWSNLVHTPRWVVPVMPSFYVAPENLPVGGVCDDHGRLLTFKSKRGFNWKQFSYDRAGNILGSIICASSKSDCGYKSVVTWQETTRNENGKPLTWHNSDGNWKEWVYDEKGKLLRIVSNTGYWAEVYRDEHFVIFRDSDNYWEEKYCKSESLFHYRNSEGKWKIVIKDKNGAIKNIKRGRIC